MGYPAKGRADFWEGGTWNAVCAQCNRKRKANEMQQLPPGVPGAGMYVCYPEHWDARHPQEFVRAVPDVMTTLWAQPGSEDQVFSIACTQAGTANAITLTSTQTTIGPFTGQILEFTATTTNTTAATATFKGVTKAILLNNAVLVAGDITLGGVYKLEYLQNLATRVDYFALSSV